MHFRFPLATTSWDADELAAMQRVISTGIFTMGKEVKEFEHRFASYFGAKHAIMVNSGSSANLLMTAALFYTSNQNLRLRRGDEIIVPSVGWSTTFFPLYQYGLHLKFVDVNLDTLNYDISALKNAVTTKTRAIMIVNLLGNPNEFSEIEDIASERGIILLEDNCESMGASYKGKYCGTFGVLGSFSCFFSHHISTMEGGVIITSDEELYHILLSLRSHGWTRNLPEQNCLTSGKLEDDFQESWRFILPGYNVRPTELSGAVGSEQLKKLPDIILGRRTNASLLKTVLEDHPDIVTQSEVETSSWFGFSLLIKPNSKLTRSELVQKLSRLGFETRPIVSGNFTKKEVMRYLNYSISGTLKNAELIDSHGLFIGNHHYQMNEAMGCLSKL
jgi:CDP-6-deoxy-D-xylo-4-hexulose-3-dehydrase